MPSRFRPLLLATSLALATGSAVAETEEDLLLSFGEEEFLSIATGQKQLISKAPAVASVITANDIREMGANSLEEVLESVPGVHVSLSSGYASPIYVFRGIYTDKNPQVLMLVNGMPITSMHFGDRLARQGFPVRSIARVEVIRGPGSAVYGADAFSGVINIITKSADDIDGTEVGARGASFDTYEGWFLQSAEIGDAKLALSIEASQTDGDDSRRIRSDAQSLFDAAVPGIVKPFYPDVSLAPGSLETRSETIDLRVDLQWNDLSVRFWNARVNDQGTGPGLALALDPNGEGEADNYYFDIGWTGRNLLPDTTLELRGSYVDLNVDTRQTLFPAGAVLPIGPDGNINTFVFEPIAFANGYIGEPSWDETQLRLDAILTWEGIYGHSIRAATGYSDLEEEGSETKNFGPGVLDISNRDCTSGYLDCNGIFRTVVGEPVNVTNTPWVFISEEDRQIWYASIQDQWQLANDWNLTIGVRYDDYSDFGSTVNPRAALVWDATKDITAKALYGRAFRAPSFAELYLRNNPVALGNESLDPEVINTYELAVDYRASFDLRLGFNVFYYEIEDLIDFAATPGGALVAGNIGEQEGSGFEVETEWKPTDTLKLIANYAYQDSEDTSTNDTVARAPAQQFYLRGNWEFIPNWSVTGELNWVGEREREAFDVRDEIDDYTLANLKLERRNLFDHLDLSLRIQNAFDENALEPSPGELVPAGSLMPDDFPLAERSYHVTAQVRF